MGRPEEGGASRWATIRLYGELNDFVGPADRQRDIRLGFHVGPTVKDVVEGLGVPHTEVELLVVDGEPVGFGHRLVGGERVGAFPRFTRLGLPPGTGLQPPLPAEVRFLADLHLAPLARHLRLLGFDTRLATPDEPDARLAGTAAAEDRVVLSRDRGLLKRRIVALGHYVRGDDPEAQLAEVVARFGIAGAAAPFTRCLVCNGLLDDVEKASVEEHLQAGTRREHDEFRRCRSCRRVYWAGSHHARLAEVVARVGEVVNVSTVEQVFDTLPPWAGGTLRSRGASSSNGWETADLE